MATKCLLEEHRMINSKLNKKRKVVHLGLFLLLIIFLDYNGHYKKKDRYAKKGAYQKHYKNEAKHNKPQMSAEEIKRRTCVDSENFPPLVVQETKSVEPETVAEPEVKGGINKDKISSNNK